MPEKQLCESHLIPAHCTHLGKRETKLADDIVARLSELAEAKVGWLTFYFAAQKLKKLDAEVAAFSRFHHLMQEIQDLPQFIPACQRKEFSNGLIGL